MADVSDKVQEELETLRTLRDEIRVQANLGAKEIRDLWEGAERKWSQAEAKAEELRKASADSGRDVAAALGILGDSIREAYSRIKSRL